MFAPRADSVLSPSLSRTAGPAPASALEDEVTGLFDQLGQSALRYLLTLGLSPHDAEEVIQEVFLALFQHLRNGRPRSNLRGWIFRVAHNLGLKRFQSKRREVLVDTLGEELDRGLNPEEQAAGRQRQQRLLAVVGVLPDQDRRCLYLRAEGLRYREIAEVLGISLGGVALSLERSLTRLKSADAR